MMMVPYMFNDDLMDDLFNDNWERDFDRAMHSMQPRHMFGKRSANVMKTDVRETKDGYDVFVDLPGFKKEDVKLDLQNGYLTITANRSEDLDEKDNEGRYIRQERCTGSCDRQRRFCHERCHRPAAQILLLLMRLSRKANKIGMGKPHSKP